MINIKPQKAKIEKGSVDYYKRLHLISIVTLIVTVVISLVVVHTFFYLPQIGKINPKYANYVVLIAFLIVMLLIAICIIDYLKKLAIEELEEKQDNQKKAEK